MRDYDDYLRGREILSGEYLEPEPDGDAYYHEKMLEENSKEDQYDN